MSTDPFHSSEQDDYGTPSEWVELARDTLGGIDFDPTSSSYWNHWVVKASHYESADALRVPWFGRCLWNFPSSKEKGISIKPFWERGCEFYRDSRVDSAVYIGFTYEQLQVLQACPMHPLQFICHFPCERIPFLVRTPGNGPPARATGPRHGNFIALLPSRASPHVARQQMRRFLDGVARLELAGATVRPM